MSLWVIKGVRHSKPHRHKSLTNSHSNLTTLYEIDYELFHFINSGCQNFIFDWLLPILREKKTWIPLYLFLFAFLLINFGKKGLYVAMAMALTVGLADITSSHVIKKTVKRLRPCHILIKEGQMELRAKCGSGYSFPSSHAANHFAMGVFLGLVFGKRWRWVKWAGLIWAAAISFSQVYVGVHFPFDILIGGLLGSFIAYLVWGAFQGLIHLPLQKYFA